MKTAGYLSKYLKADDFKEPQLLTIESVREEKIGEDKQEKLVLYVAEHEPGIVLGPTTIRQIEKALGSDETDEWLGYKIVAFNDTTVMFGGRQTGGIRFRAPKQGSQVVTPPSKQATRNSKPPAGVDGADDLPF